MKHTTFSLAVFAIALSSLTACKEESEWDRIQEEAAKCRVIKLTTPKIDNPVCMIECTYRKGGNAGFASAVQVDCEWYGEPVTRKN